LQLQVGLLGKQVFFRETHFSVPRSKQKQTLK
jgi:hypothetical protein